MLSFLRFFFIFQIPLQNCLQNFIHIILNIFSCDESSLEDRCESDQKQ